MRVSNRVAESSVQRSLWQVHRDATNRPISSPDTLLTSIAHHHLWTVGHVHDMLGIDL